MAIPYFSNVTRLSIYLQIPTESFLPAKISQHHNQDLHVVQTLKWEKLQSQMKTQRIVVINFRQYFTNYHGQRQKFEFRGKGGAGENTRGRTMATA
jgi:hypothetical protein